MFVLAWSRIKVRQVGDAARGYVSLKLEILSAFQLVRALPTPGMHFYFLSYKSRFSRFAVPLEMKHPKDGVQENWTYLQKSSYASEKNQVFNGIW